MSYLRGCDASCDRPVSERRYDPRLMRNSICVWMLYSTSVLFTLHTQHEHVFLSLSEGYPACCAAALRFMSLIIAVCNKQQSLSAHPMR